MRPLALTLTALALLTSTGPAKAGNAKGDPHAFAISKMWSKVFHFSFELAGRDLNGTALNGDALDGRKVAWVWLDEGTVDGAGVELMWLDGTRFEGIDTNGKKIKPKDLRGAELVAQLDDGSALTLIVGDIRRHPEKYLRDVLGYEVWFETAAGLEPLCGYDEQNEPTVAIPLAGRWSYQEGTPEGGAHLDDPFAFTFACEGYVLAKCVTAGYKPWAKTMTCAKKQGCTFGDLTEHHQACTRALRGDYFGDGTAHTTDGTLLNLYDDFGVRYDSESWPIEAEWSGDGAICVAAPRHAEHSATVAPLYDPSCGQAGFTSGAVLLTELEP